jgi:hypothetical protein
VADLNRTTSRISHPGLTLILDALVTGGKVLFSTVFSRSATVFLNFQSNAAGDLL